MVSISVVFKVILPGKLCITATLAKTQKGCSKHRLAKMKETHRIIEKIEILSILKTDRKAKKHRLIGRGARLTEGRCLAIRRALDLDLYDLRGSIKIGG